MMAHRSIRGDSERAGPLRLLRAYASLLRAIFAAFRSFRVQALLLSCLMIALTQAVIFTRLEGWSFLDAFYFSVVSMATVGYGDIVPVTPAGKLATLAFLVVGIGIFVLTVSSIAQTILHRLVLAERREGRAAGVHHSRSYPPRDREHDNGG